MLSKKDIEKELGKGINIYPFHPENIKENSINLSIGRNAWSLGAGSVVPDDKQGFILAQNGAKNKTYIAKGDSAIVKKGKEHYLILLPHTTTIVETSEVIGVDRRIGGTIHSKVGVVAQGVGHIGTMLGPAFCGHLMISLHNITNDVIAIKVGTTFISVVFHHLETPSAQVKNSNISGHVDKLSELGISINTSTREYLMADWKCRLDGIRDKMKGDERYKEYKKKLTKQKYEAISKYLNLHNCIMLVICFVILWAFWRLATYVDTKNGTVIWTDRYWTVIITAIIVPLVMSVAKLFKER